MASKMKHLISILLFSCMLLFISGTVASSPEEMTSPWIQTNKRGSIRYWDEEQPTRQKRFTCNSFGCRAHCLVLGRKHGYCSRQNVCLCVKWFSSWKIKSLLKYKEFFCIINNFLWLFWTWVIQYLLGKTQRQ